MENWAENIQPDCLQVQAPRRGCILEGIYKLFKGRKSVILGVWAALGASGAISLGTGASPPAF